MNQNYKSYECLIPLFNWAEVAVKPDQGFLNKFVSGGDVVSFEHFQFLMFIRSPEKVKHGPCGSIRGENRIVFSV